MSKGLLKDNYIGEKYGRVLDVNPVLIQLQDNYSINT